MSWYSPKGIDIRANSVNDSGINTFTNKVLESLVRETIQNSLDAATSDKPVLMEFDLEFTNLRDHIDIQHFFEEAIPNASLRWKKDEKANTFLKSFSHTLHNDKLPILRISDFNTTGLENDQWKALVNEAGSSFKLNSNAGGSFGIGKSAPFAASDLRMVFYNTMTKNNATKSIGITRFISYEVKEYTTEGVMYYGSNKRSPFSLQTVFNFDSRTEPGTDIFVLGFNRTEEWVDMIIISVLKNFMVSIYTERIVIKVGGYLINKENLKSILDLFSHEPSLARTIKYHNVLENPQRIEIDLSDSFLKYDFEPQDAKLIIAESENSTRNVLMTRSTGMQIYEMNRITSTIQFDGVFLATGKYINEVLRLMENPAHDSWESDIIIDPDLRKKFNNLKKDLFRFIKNSVMDSYKKEVDEIIDALGVNDFLPSGNSSKTKIENLDFDIQNIELRSALTRKRNVNPNDSHHQLDNDDVNTEDGGNLGGNEKGNEKSQEAGEGEGRGGLDADGNERVTEDGNQSRKAEKTLNASQLKNISSRVIENNYLQGEYVLNLTSKENFDVLVMRVNILDEKENSHSSNIVHASLEGISVLKNNKIMVSNFAKDKNYQIKIKINSSRRTKLEVLFYENN